jgi:YidC/Oxa1 family membrane protein insertase
MPFANVIEDAFSPLIRLFEGILVFLYEAMPFNSWGWSIVGLTVVVRGALVPLTFRQLKSMQEMQRLTPQIQALKEKYKEDKQRQQQELMKFYQENKINPLASCLPFLFQIPVFISLFYMLRTDLKKHICGPQMVHAYNQSSHSKNVFSVGHVPTKFIEDHVCSEVAPHLTTYKFLFIPDITAKATGVALVVLILAYVGSQVASTLVATASADPNQRRLLLVLPIVFVVILYRYPAGLLVYWITTNLWTIGQQLVIRRHMGPAPPAPKPTTGAANGKPPSRLKQALAAGAGGAAVEVPAAAPTSAPPPPPRKKKKRSGRRR